MQGRVVVLTLLLSITAGGGTSAVHSGDPQQDIAVTISEESRGWLGVSIADVPADRAKKTKAGATAGALVTDVQKDSPAEKAGVKEDDVIIQFGERTVEDVEDLQKAVGKAKPGSSVKVTLLRGDRKMTLMVTVGKTPKNKSLGYWYGGTGPMRAFTRHFHLSMESRLYGLDVWELNQQMGEYFGAPNGRGVLVISVEQESEGARAGFKAGDVIVRVGRETIEDIRDVSEGFEEFKEGESVPVEVLRKGERKTLNITADDDEALLGAVGRIAPPPDVPVPPDIDVLVAPRIQREQLNNILRLKREALREREAMEEVRSEFEKIKREARQGARELQQSLWKEVGAATI